MNNDIVALELHPQDLKRQRFSKPSLALAGDTHSGGQSIVETIYYPATRSEPYTLHPKMKKVLDRRELRKYKKAERNRKTAQRRKEKR